MYAVDGGSSAGIAARPYGPTVYSVARTWSVPSCTVEPSGSEAVACVPAGKRTVAWRVPSPSVTGLPRATCISAAPAWIAVVTVSKGTRTTVSARA